MLIINSCIKGGHHLNTTSIDPPIIFMRIITFVDLENFRHSLWNSNRNRQPKYSSLNLICEDLIKKLGWEKYNPRHIRTYLYTGEYTDNIIREIKRLQTILTQRWQKQKLEKALYLATKRREAQINLFDYLHNPFDYYITISFIYLSYIQIYTYDAQIDKKQRFLASGKNRGFL